MKQLRKGCVLLLIALVWSVLIQPKHVSANTLEANKVPSKTAGPNCDKLMLFATNLSSLDGFSFANTINSIKQQSIDLAQAANNLGAATQAFDTGIALIQGIVPCNEIQHQWKEIILDQMNWLAAWYVCYYDYYLQIASGGASVNDWLACVSPVNAGVIDTSNRSSEIYYQVLTTPCNPNYQPPSGVPTLAGAAYRVAQETVQQFTQAVQTVRGLRKAIARGVNIAVNPERSAQAYVRLYTRKSTWQKIAQSQATQLIADTASQVRIKLAVPATDLDALAGQPGPRDFQIEVILQTQDGETATAVHPFTLSW